MPPAVARAHTRAVELGFSRSCTPAVGALLAALAGAVPPGGRILELGTGVGYGLAWLTHGLRGRDDVELTSVDAETELLERVADEDWPAWTRLRADDALRVLRDPTGYDLIFADAPAGKVDGLDLTIAALNAGGVLVLDDMNRRPDDPELHALWPQLQAVRRQVLDDPRLVCAELDCAGGVLICTRRHDALG